jgi:hypothetical protein
LVKILIVRIALVILAIPINLLCYSQSVSTQISGRSAALGGIYCTLQEGWSATGNIAATSLTQQTNVGTGYELIPNVAGANRVGAFVTTPMLSGMANISLFRFGNQHYSESVFGVGYAHKIKQSAIGFGAQAIQYNATGFGSKTRLSFTFSGLHSFGEHLILGAYLQNVTQTTLDKETQEKLPTRMAIGLCWKPTAQIGLYAEMFQDPKHPSQIKFGVEYSVTQKFTIRSGVQPKPSLAACGFGFTHKQISVDTALQYFWSGLGWRQQTTLSYRINKP